MGYKKNILLKDNKLLFIIQQIQSIWENKEHVNNNIYIADKYLHKHWNKTSPVNKMYTKTLCKQSKYLSIMHMIMAQISVCRISVTLILIG